MNVWIFGGNHGESTRQLIYALRQKLVQHEIFDEQKLQQEHVCEVEERQWLQWQERRAEQAEELFVAAERGKVGRKPVESRRLEEV